MAIGKCVDSGVAEIDDGVDLVVFQKVLIVNDCGHWTGLQFDFL